jgi:hypothetical protein
MLENNLKVGDMVKFITQPSGALPLIGKVGVVTNIKRDCYIDVVVDGNEWTSHIERVLLFNNASYIVTLC